MDHLGEINYFQIEADKTGPSTQAQMARFLPIFVAIDVQLGFRASGCVKTSNFLNPTRPQQESFYSFPKTITSFPDHLRGALCCRPTRQLPASPARFDFILITGGSVSMQLLLACLSTQGI